MTELTPVPPADEGGPPLRRLARSIGRLYRSEWAVFRADYKRYFKMAARVLGVGFVLGWAVFYFRPELAQKGLAYVLRSLKDIPLGAPPVVLTATLFYHNSRASLLAAAAGLIPFVSLPILDPLANGAALGLIAAISGRQGLNVPMLLLKGVVPHGIFEIPAVLYATSIGIFISVELGKKIWAALRGAKGEPASGDGEIGHDVASPRPEGPAAIPADPNDSPAAPPSFGEILAQAVRSFVLVVLPLLLVAAFIEAYITPLLV